MNQDQYHPASSETAPRSRKRPTTLLANTFGGTVYTEQDEKKLSSCLNASETLSVYKEYREFGNELQGKPGARLLDVGCGIGDTCRKLAERVGPEGHVVGLDTSISRLNTAKRLTHENNKKLSDNIKWVQGAAEKLPFADASFDGVRIERTLQHIKNVPAVIREVGRVLSPNGSLIAVDPEWERFSIKSEKTDSRVTLEILDYWKNTFACGDITEQMPKWLSEEGFELVEVKTFWLDYDHSFYLAEILFDLTRLASATADQGLISGREAKIWLKGLREAEQTNQLRWSMPLKLFYAKR